jgi:diamine N-acetyltransferase
MTLSIRPVTKDNWRELIKLKVRDDQTHLVASNLYSIAEAQFESYDDDHLGTWVLFPYGIYDAESPVGFLMYATNHLSLRMQIFILRLMVDVKYQGKGYGKFGMEKMIEIARADAGVKVVGISYEPENEVARGLYARYGFVETGEMIEGETLALLRLQP